MDYETALQRTMTAAYDCVRAMSLMGEANQLINEALKNCDSLISSDSKELFLQINKSIKDEIHVTNVASESIFNLMKHFISEYPSATPYRTIVVPRGYVSFEDEGRILISIPEPCEHGGYSIWFSKRFVSEDPSDNFLQIRYYPDWKFRLYKYEQAPSGSFYPTKKMEVVADQMLEDFKIIENSVRYAEGYSLS